MVEVRKTNVYVTWLDSLRDARARARILVRVSAWLLEIREMLGLLVKAYRNFGSTTDPAAGSFKEQRSKIVILLAGGNKQTQSRDIKMALRLARNL